MTLVLAAWLLQSAAACSPDAIQAVDRARRSARDLDLASATAAYESAARLGCEDAMIAAVYLEGLQAARRAYAAGGSDASLAPVRAAIDSLAARVAAGSPTADLVRTVLLAAAAAAQSERDDMSTFLTHAAYLETLQRSAHSATALPLSALEVAGDLWLQVHRFDTARDAYRAAADLLGPTPHIMSGLARTAVRLNDTKGACESYRALQTTWGSRSPEPSEVVEARRYVADHDCSRPR